MDCIRWRDNDRLGRSDADVHYGMPETRGRPACAQACEFGYSICSSQEGTSELPLGGMEMHSPSVPVCLAFFSIINSSAFAEETVGPLNVTDLRAEVRAELLEPRVGELTPLLAHIWKSNGGAIIAREPG